MPIHPWQQVLCYVYSPEGSGGCYELTGSWENCEQGGTMQGTLRAIFTLVYGTVTVGCSVSRA
jgi:hypothetical protein